jgi:hypothetical protein
MTASVRSILLRMTALASRDPNDFANVPLGGTVKLADPQEALAFYLAGTDSGQVTIPPAPALASAERAGEMVEDYWMALTRDIPFSYGEAHGVVAGATVTALRAFFDESAVILNPVVAADDGQSLLPYTGSDAGEIAVGGELNKLANNVALGRDIAAVHWRSDATQALLLGETMAISILRDQHLTFNESFDGFTFTKFDGSTITA